MKKAIIWAVFNGGMLLSIWAAINGNKNAESLVFCVSWFAIFCGLCSGSEKAKEYLRRTAPSVPALVSGTFDVLFFAALAWGGYLITAVFWAFAMATQHNAVYSERS